MPKNPTKTTAAPAAKKVNKSAWIRALPATMSAKDVVAKGKAEGIKLSLAQIYTARSTAKKATRIVAKGKPGRPKGSKNTIKATVSSDLVHLKRAVFEHGFSKVEAFLADLKKSVGL